MRKKARRKCSLRKEETRKQRNTSIKNEKEGKKEVFI